MAYKDGELYNRALAVFKERKPIFIEDVVALVGCSKTTFYQHVPIDSDEMNNIKQLLESNRVNMKMDLRGKMAEGKGAEVIALYKILANEGELKALNGQYIDHTTKGKSLNVDPKEWV